MGRIRTKDIKSVGQELWESNPGKFSIDFEATKTDLNAFGFKISKRNRNKIAGYITRNRKIQARGPVQRAYTYRERPQEQEYGERRRAPRRDA